MERNMNIHMTRESTHYQCLRKRKEHDDDKEENLEIQESVNAKSGGDLMGNFIIKWMKTNTREEVEDFGAKDGDQQNREFNLPWSLLHRQRKDSTEENSEPMEKESKWSPMFSNPHERCNMVMSLSNHQEEHFTATTKSVNKHSHRKSNRISNKLSSIETKIEEAEAEFEVRKGHRLSQADKMKDETLGNLKLKQVNLRLKHDLKTSNKETDYGNIRFTSSSVKRLSVKNSAEEDRDKIIQKLKEIRQRNDRPEQLELMTREQMIDEKIELQRHLTDYERVHGLQEDKNIMADLYERCRLLLCQTRTRHLSLPSMSCLGELASIPEDVPLVLESREQRSSLYNVRRESWSGLGSVQERFVTDLGTGKEEKSFISLPLVIMGPDIKDVSNSEDKMCSYEVLPQSVDNYHNMSRSELESTLRKMREDKNFFRNQMRDFEQKIQEENGRQIYKEEKKEFNSHHFYKEIRSNIKLADALLSKYSSDILDH